MDWYRLLPRYWIQNKPTDYEWDKVLNKILDNAKNVELNYLAATIDGVTVWNSNYPYAYGSTYGTNMPKTGLPKVATRKRLRKFLNEYRAEHIYNIIKDRP